MASKLNKIKATERLHALTADSQLQTRLGAVLRARRHQLDITQEELGQRADVHRTYVADVERGARNVTLRTVAKLAKGLQITIGHLFAHVTASPETTSRNGAAPAKNEVQEILLVEHNAAAAAATALAFKRAKLANPLRIVRDGEAGLEYLLGTGAFEKTKPARPNLILLVPDLPRMSGSEFLRRIKADERTRDIPVVLLTVSHRLRR
jgi:transcriptional regulator with XRE-family HTH domain